MNLYRILYWQIIPWLFDDNNDQLNFKIFDKVMIESQDLLLS